MKVSSSFKVGILALVALFILLFTVLWVKGRSFSSAERIEIQMKDVNGMRPGSGVQMMGLRVGQVEEITPIVDGESSYVKLKFVITEPNITIPKASMISIQQSGLIGEQFLEITPPKIRTLYIPAYRNDSAYADDAVQIKLDDKFYDVGIIKKASIMSTKTIPVTMQEQIKTLYAFKVDYIVNLPGLILPEFMTGNFIKENGEMKLRIEPLDGTPLPYPSQTSPYTIIEPMRIADFMDLQYRAAESLTETNQKLNDLLSDELIANLKQSVININELTVQATTTLEKAEKLVDSSKSELDDVVTSLNKMSDSFVRLSTNINRVMEDEKFKPTFYNTAESISKLSNNLAAIMGEIDAKKFGEDLNAVMQNVNEISDSVNKMTKDEKLKTKLTTAIDNVNNAMMDISCAISAVDSTQNKSEIQKVMTDISQTTGNLRKFSEKLNKRFLLFRLMF